VYFYGTCWITETRTDTPTKSWISAINKGQVAAASPSFTIASLRFAPSFAVSLFLSARVCFHFYSNIYACNVLFCDPLFVLHQIFLNWWSRSLIIWIEPILPECYSVATFSSISQLKLQTFYLISNSFNSNSSRSLNPKLGFTPELLYLTFTDWCFIINSSPFQHIIDSEINKFHS